MYLPPEAEYIVVKEEAEARILNLWEAALTGRHLFNIYPGFNKIPWFQTIKASRRVISILIRLRLGQKRAPTRLHHMM